MAEAHVGSLLLSTPKAPMNRFFLSGVIASLALIGMSGCSANAERVSLAEVTRPQTLTLSKRSSQGSVHGLSIELSGRIDGEASIAIILDGKPYRLISLSGEVRVTEEMDWYSDTAQIVYTPKSVRSGSLTIVYRFRS